ncbi:probable HTH-type transcriptional regulator LeuO [Salmonella enterica subsp. arizonae]|uniref:Probable HTH-type transcriptional regulator LeuO n=1 Tax=Salmonella enterica subsp. arizonae TaxID=59203 RepID=A0A379SZL9_SALER|nr:probable HTH-type transcriptional regulator LeuO [Salmonella enterica subsp. arizonae]
MPEVKTEKPHLLEMGKPQLRMVDLNLLTVFDAVMQEQNITRAAHTLGMSQPAVSNAVARLKVMFNDELFVRYGRGIQRLPAHFSYLVQSARRCNWYKMNYRDRGLSRSAANVYSTFACAVRWIIS